VKNWCCFPFFLLSSRLLDNYSVGLIWEKKNWGRERKWREKKTNRFFHSFALFNKYLSYIFHWVLTDSRSACSSIDKYSRIRTIDLLSTLDSYTRVLL
jgi:hypothetical protein